MTGGRPVRLTDIVTAADAAVLVHPSCRPLVRGLLAVLDDPATGADPATTRHAWVELELQGPVPVGRPLAVTATRWRTTRLGAGDGIWIDVDVDGPDGPLIRSRHVVASALAAHPPERASLPPVSRPGAGASVAGSLVVDDAALAAYRRAAGDTSPVHAEGAPAPIVPGLLALWSALGVAGLSPRRVEARFPAPLVVGAPASVVRDGDALALADADRTVVRARVG